MVELTPSTPHDERIIEQQLGRMPRGIAGIAARCICGNPTVVATKPRLDDGTPFPTTFYLTDPHISTCLSRLEAAGLMKEWSEELAQDPALADEYEKAHRAYLQARKEIGEQFGQPELEHHKDFSAGGMPQRVKCLHALAGQSLAVGPGVNPIGDRALELIHDSWTPEKCYCELSPNEEKNND